MSQVKDGGPAYPRTGVGNAGQMYDVQPQDGMSLRDWFAGQALAGLAKSSSWIFSADDVYDDKSSMSIGTCAYKIADAMLVERERSG